MKRYSIDSTPDMTECPDGQWVRFEDVERMLNEMKRHLPILERLEANGFAWNRYSQGTGIATLNGYRAALTHE